MHHNVKPENVEAYAEKTISGIYIITALESGKFYIGSAVDFAARWSLHRHELRNGKHKNTPLLRAYQKYGEDGLSFKVIERVEDVSKLLDREQHWMDILKPQYNINPTAKSRLGSKHSPASIEKMRIASTGRKKSRESIEKQRAKMLGRRHTPETIAKLTGRKHPPGTGAKISAANKGRKMSPESLAKMSETKRAQKRKCITTDETRAKISEKLKGNKNGLGRLVSEETRSRISVANKGRIRTPECLRKMSEAKRLWWATKGQDPEFRAKHFGRLSLANKNKHNQISASS